MKCLFIYLFIYRRRVINSGSFDKFFSNLIFFEKNLESISSDLYFLFFSIKQRRLKIFMDDGMLL